MTHRTISFVLTPIAALAVASATLGSGFYNLGQGTEGWGASNGGSPIVAGQAGNDYFMWTADGGIVLIGGSGLGGGHAAIDNAGTTISGTLLNTRTSKNEAAVYDILTGTWTSLGTLGFSCDASASSGWDISGDGSTVVGLGWVAGCRAHGVYSVNGGPLVDLGSTVPNRSTRANGTSFDGSVIVGWQDTETGSRQGAFWNSAGVQTLLSFEGNPVGEAGAVSDDGNVMIGGGGFALAGQAYRWTAETGVASLGSIFDPSWSGSGTALNADGSTVIGFYRPFGPAVFGEGFIWTEANGMENLTTWVTNQGVELPPQTVLALPLGMSSDGRTITGLARVGFSAVGFVVILPEAKTDCPADLNNDGTVDGADLGLLLAAWGTSNEAADLNGDNVVDGADLGLLLSAWGDCE